MVSEQIPFGTDNFAENPEPRCPCVLLLDTSGSMAGRPIDELNAGLVAYKDSLAADGLASRRVEVAVVTFGGHVAVAHDFSTPEHFHPPTLQAGGDTPMGQAILRGVEMVRDRKQVYKANGVSYYRPWVFLITDGGPTDEWRSAAEAVKAGETSKAFSFFAVGVEGANLERLAEIATRPPLKLAGLQFRNLFLWLSQSQQSVSRSSPGDKLTLPAPTWTIEV